MKRSRTINQAAPPELAQRKGEARPYLTVLRGREQGLIVPIESEAVVIGRDSMATLVLQDPSVSRRHALILRRGEEYWLEDMKSTNGVYVNGVRTGAQALSDGDRIQLGPGAILRFAYQDQLESDYQRKVYDWATRDELTAVLNRRSFTEAIESDIQHACANGWTLSLLLIDLDYFKSVNDSYGHLRGDHTLRVAAQSIQQALRPEDLLARYGGEEFVVLLRFTDEERAVTVAERVRATVEERSRAAGQPGVPVTASIGTATLQPGRARSASELIREADEALLEAKRRGRNQVLAHSGLDSRHAALPRRSDRTTPVRVVTATDLERHGE